MLRDWLHFMPEDGARAICLGRFSVSVCRDCFLSSVRLNPAAKPVTTVSEGRIPIIGTLKVGLSNKTRQMLHILNQFPIIFSVKIDEICTCALWHISYRSIDIDRGEYHFDRNKSPFFEEMVCFLCQLILKY